MEEWWLYTGSVSGEPRSTEKKTINENGDLVAGKNFICMKKDEALIEAHKRASKYLKNGNPKPQGNRFFLVSKDGTYCVCFHDV